MTTALLILSFLVLCARVSCSVLFPTDVLRGVGSNTFWPVVRDWSHGYQEIDPAFDIDFEIESVWIAVEEEMADVIEDFAIIEFMRLNSSQYEAGYRVIPFIQTTLVPQFNLPFIDNIVLEREVLPRIYMGNITTWNDPAIVATNPNVSLPNETIRVFYRDGSSGITQLWMTGLSAWSETWNETYNISQDFPNGLRTLPNLYSMPSALLINAAVAATNYSIGYVPYFLVKRDPNLCYAKLIHKFTGEIVEADQLDVEDASNTKPLNSRLEGDYDVDGDHPDAWPLASYVYMMIHSHPLNCTRARKMYQFFHWALTASSSKEATRQDGYECLPSNITAIVLQSYSNIQCDGRGIGYYENSEEKGALELSFLIFAILALVAGLILSGLHIYYFSVMQINMLYSLVFVIGTALTLLSPIFWYTKPTEGICLARVWTLSVGFTILLATMFSRTWQLHDIYTLEKKRKMDTLKSRSAIKSLMQFLITLCSVIFLNFVIVVLWTCLDPLIPEYVIVDQYRLTGYWTCHCQHMTKWLLVELFFFLALLCFGIYVIYKTWSFQRQALLTETRWVLVALYNIIMNLAAVAPLLSFVTLSENTLGVIAIASVDISGGSIICAVLLPRIISKLELSTHSHDKNQSGGSPPITMPTTTRGPRMKTEVSRTPEEDLIKRLQEPQPIRMQMQQRQTLHKDEIELQPLHETSEALELSASHNVLISKHVTQTSPAILEESLEDFLPGATTNTELRWTSNPIKEVIAE